MHCTSVIFPFFRKQIRVPPQRSSVSHYQCNWSPTPLQASFQILTEKTGGGHWCILLYLQYSRFKNKLYYYLFKCLIFPIWKRFRSEHDVQRFFLSQWISARSFEALHLLTPVGLSVLVRTLFSLLFLLFVICWILARLFKWGRSIGRVNHVCELFILDSLLILVRLFVLGELFTFVWCSCWPGFQIVHFGQYIYVGPVVHVGRVWLESSRLSSCSCC